MGRRMRLVLRAENPFQVEEGQKDRNERKTAEVERNGMREKVIL